MIQANTINMNFHNIEYFIAIIEEKNISRAAEKLHISQQSLSEQLKKLENELDTVLIDRSQPMELTESGKIFLENGTEILSIYKKMLNEIEDHKKKDKQKITIAIPATETPPFLPGLLTEFTSENSEITVNLVKIEPKEAVHHVHDFDLYFSTLPLGTQLNNITLIKDQYAVAFSASLARKVYGDNWPAVEAELKERRDLSVLSKMPFIFLKNRVGEIVLDQQIIFHDAGFEPDVSFKSENSELNSNMCVLGSGAYVATFEYCSRLFKDTFGKPGGILLYPINTNIYPVEIALSHRKGMKLKKADKLFVEFAKDYLKRTSRINEVDWDN